MLFLVVWIFLGSLGVICCSRWVLNEGHRNYFKDRCLVNSQPTFLFLTYFNSELWPYYQKDNTAIIRCESFLESNSPDIFALCESNLDGSIDSGNFSMRGYLPLIRKDSTTHMHGLAVYVKEGLPFARDLSLENSLLFSTGFTSLSVLLLFPLSITFFVFMHDFWFYFI